MINLPKKAKKNGRTEKEKYGKNKDKGPLKCEPSPGVQIDEVEIEIEGITMRLRRKVNLQVPHEITAVIPRAEIRKRTFEAGVLACEEEILLNSITIVHTPRHPLAGEKQDTGDQKQEQGLTPSPQNPLKLNAVKSEVNTIPSIKLSFSSPG